MTKPRDDKPLTQKDIDRGVEVLISHKYNPRAGLCSCGEVVRSDGAMVRHQVSLLVESGWQAFYRRRPEPPTCTDDSQHHLVSAPHAHMEQFHQGVAGWNNRSMHV